MTSIEKIDTERDKMTETEFKKILDIEEAIINRLHHFAKEANSDGGVTKNWSREGISVLSKALKDVTSVKMMNLQMFSGVDDDEDESGIVAVHGMAGPGHPDFPG